MNEMEIAQAVAEFGALGAVFIMLSRKVDRLSEKLAHWTGVMDWIPCLKKGACSDEK